MYMYLIEVYFFYSKVFKYSKLGSSEPAMILGTAFKPGSGFGHFCQPSSVAIDNSGNFYIADG